MIAISIPEFSKNPFLLRDHINISKEHLNQILQTIDKLGLAKISKDEILPQEPQIHLPKDSLLYRAWLNQIRLISTQRITQLNKDDIFSFHAVFSVDLSTKNLIHKKFLEFLKFCEQTVKISTPKQVIQMSFDLFPWTS